MPFYRYTMFMQFVPNAPPCGFSESWENEASSDTNARNTMQTLIQRRRAVLSSSWLIQGARIAKLSIGTSDVPPPTHAIIKQSLVQPLVCQVSNEGQLGVADTPWTSILVEMTKNPVTGVDSKPRQQQMRGIPDSWWTAAALTIPAGDAAAVTGFFSYITSALAGFAGGQVRIVDNALMLQRYRGICLKRISSRRIGRPFGLLRGAQSRQVVES